MVKVLTFCAGSILIGADASAPAFCLIREVSKTWSVSAWRWISSTYCSMLRWPRLALPSSEIQSDSDAAMFSPPSRNLKLRRRHAPVVGFRHVSASVHRCHFCSEFHNWKIASEDKAINYELYTQHTSHAHTHTHTHTMEAYRR